ncbi:MAG TPA: hypothetical protein VIS72_12230 [Anaerolineales bacterium]
MGQTVTGLVMMVFGLLAMLGAALNWRIVSRSGKFLNMMLGDTFARVIYFLVGVLIFVLGLEQFLGANWF